MSDEILLSDRERRLEAGNRIKTLDDVLFPRLKHWNYSPCSHHETPEVSCAYRECGGELFSHQRVGVAWLYTVRKGLLADDPGVGKTNQIIALTALLKEKKELGRRAIIIPNTPAVNQWEKEFNRWSTGLNIAKVDSSSNQTQRINAYASSWDVLIIGSHLVIKDRELLERLAPFDLVVNDDVDPLLNHSNSTHAAIRQISHNATRSFTVNATTLQIRPQQLHAALVPSGGYDVFGSLGKFERDHIETRLVSELTPQGRVRRRRQQVGLKNNEELKAKLRSVYLRRKATELTDIRMPQLMPPVVEWIEMSPQQQAKYAELQQGVLRIMREEGTKVKHLNALTQYLYGQQICAGLPALGEPDGPGASPKLDRLFDRLDSVWADRKTIVFVKNIGMVKAAFERTKERDYDCAIIWGQKQNAAQREEQKNKFWDDPNCRFLIGTTSLERSHNLQCANTVVAIDSHLNPARMHQLLGRAKRAGSAHDRVFMFSYFMADTQESRILDVLRQRQALYDAVFEEESDLYEALSPLELLALITP